MYMFSKEFAYLLIMCRKWKQKERWYGNSLNWFLLNVDMVSNQSTYPLMMIRCQQLQLGGWKKL